MGNQIEILPTDEFILKGELVMPILAYLQSRPSLETARMSIMLDSIISEQKLEKIKKK
jgi:hypothetical protein